MKNAMGRPSLQIRETFMRTLPLHQLYRIFVINRVDMESGGPMSARSPQPNYNSLVRSNEILTWQLENMQSENFDLKEQMAELKKHECKYKDLLDLQKRELIKLKSSGDHTDFFSLAKLSNDSTREQNFLLQIRRMESHIQELEGLLAISRKTAIHSELKNAVLESGYCRVIADLERQLQIEQMTSHTQLKVADKTGSKAPVKAHSTIMNNMELELFKKRNFGSGENGRHKMERQPKSLGNESQRIVLMLNNSDVEPNV